MKNSNDEFNELAKILLNDANLLIMVLRNKNLMLTLSNLDAVLDWGEMIQILTSSEKDKSKSDSKDGETQTEELKIETISSNSMPVE